VANHHLNIKWLEDFLCLSETNNFTQAAERRHSTQSAFSRRIKALEFWAGTTLFDRRFSPLRLTPAGEKLLPVARDVLRRLDHAQSRLSPEGSSGEEIVAFSATQVVSRCVFFPLLRRLQERVGNFQSALVTQSVDKGGASLRRGTSHFLICHTHPKVELPFSPEEAERCLLAQDRLIPVTSRNNKSGWEGVLSTPAGDSSVSWIGYQEPSCLGRAVESIHGERLRHLAFEVNYRCSDATILRAMIEQGHGFGWLPLSDIEDALRRGLLVRAGDESWDVNLDISMFRLGIPLSVRAEALWADLVSHTETAWLMRSEVA